MALEDRYSPEFERLWKVYPKWPTGRSKKFPSYRAFCNANKALNFTAEDLAEIELNIEQRKRDCVTWQKGNKFGPVMFATYMNQRLWNEPYEKVRGVSRGTSNVVAFDEEANKRAFVKDLQRKGLPIPSEYQRYVGET